MSDLFLIQLLGIDNKNRPTLVVCTGQFHTQRSVFFGDVLWITTAEVHWQHAVTATNFTTYSPQATASETAAVRRHIKMMVNKQAHALHQTIEQLRLVGKHKMSSTGNNLQTNIHKIFIPDEDLIMLNVSSTLWHMKLKVPQQVTYPNWIFQFRFVWYHSLLFLFTSLSDNHISLFTMAYTIKQVRGTEF